MACLPVPYGDDADIFIGERELDDSLNGHAVIGKEEFGRHAIGRDYLAMACKSRQTSSLGASPGVGLDKGNDVCRRTAWQKDPRDPDRA